MTEKERLNMEVAKRLKQSMDEKKMKATELAEVSGIGKSDISNYLKGKYRPKLNKHIFKPMMKRLGIAEGKTPYCARHTYSDKMKRLDNVDDKTKAAVMGHTDYKFTQSHYQSTDINDLKALVSGIE